MFNKAYARIQNLSDELLEEKAVQVDVLRLDETDPVVSGNKLFKLWYYLEEAERTGKNILTFGGPYSNHLAATAKACSERGIPVTGIVRGEKPSNLSHTLRFCISLQMELEFVSREAYDERKEDIENDNSITIPEGGYGIQGAAGASLITSYYDTASYTHVCTSVGTGTTLAGIISNNNTCYLGFSALKNLTDFKERIRKLRPGEIFNNYEIINDYSFGGYAKKDNTLLGFMNEFYTKFNIPTDFVYTGKMFFGIWDMISKDFFSRDSRLLCIHTGGLQGNLSLASGSLVFNHQTT